MIVIECRGSGRGLTVGSVVKCFYGCFCAAGVSILC